jgi:hypothetical protein
MLGPLEELVRRARGGRRAGLGLEALPPSEVEVESFFESVYKETRQQPLVSLTEWEKMRGVAHGRRKPRFLG